MGVIKGNNMFKKMLTTILLATTFAGGVYAAGVDSALIIRPKFRHF